MHESNYIAVLQTSFNLTLVECKLLSTNVSTVGKIGGFNLTLVECKYTNTLEAVHMFEF